MFDKYQPWQRLKKQSFNFKPNRYEIWFDGEMIGNGNSSFPIEARLISLNNIEKVEINIQDEKLFNEISNKIIFDDFVSSHDRLQLYTIPKETNSTCIGLHTLRMNLGTTIEVKNFTRQEPYCCNLFTKNGIIAKITFSFSNPERLIEFYQ